MSSVVIVLVVGIVSTIVVVIIIVGWGINRRDFGNIMEILVLITVAKLSKVAFSPTIELSLFCLLLLVDMNKDDHQILLFLDI